MTALDDIARERLRRWLHAASICIVRPAIGGTTTDAEVIAAARGERVPDRVIERIRKRLTRALVYPVLINTNKR